MTCMKITWQRDWLESFRTSSQCEQRGRWCTAGWSSAGWFPPAGSSSSTPSVARNSAARTGPSSTGQRRSSRLSTLKKSVWKNLINRLLKKHFFCLMARSHGLVVKADCSWPRGHGFRPGNVYWMDVSDLLATTLKKNWK